jgi:phosphohistidine swiveling domain-containing protein
MANVTDVIVEMSGSVSSLHDVKRERALPEAGGNAMRTVDRHLADRIVRAAVPKPHPNGGRSDCDRPIGDGRGVWILPLDDERTTDAARAGGKAAALARATAAGLPVLPGFVLTTAATAVARFPGDVPASLEAELRGAWCALTHSGSQALVVRSSSVVEDGASSSMAGMFESQLDVRGWEGFLDAVTAVLASAKAVPGVESAAMAVLVQPMLDAKLGGVLFGADPVTGRTDRTVLAAVDGGPDRLVSGAVDGARYVLTARGRVVSSEHPLAGIGRTQRRALAHLGARAADVFGGPQDVEWAIADDGALHLLQSRPITTTAVTAPARGPILGPGPVAETFPDALSPLEEDLWVAPLRVATVTALRLTGAAPGRAINRSPVVTTVAGRVAVDLELFGSAPRKRSFLRRLNPVPPARRLVAAWRVGRLRAALPGLAADVVAGADERLLEVPELDELDDAELLSVLHGTAPLLRALHGHEMLAGLLAADDADTATGASVALWALSAGRAAGRSDDDIATHDPVVLALAPPRVGAGPVLPPTPPVRRPAPTSPDPASIATWREALRLRARWAQELGARAAGELGVRLAERGALPDAETVRFFALTELERVVVGDDQVHAGTIAERREVPVAAPLPAAFRLTDDGEPVAVSTARRARRGTGAVAAGGGRAVGVVQHGDDGPPAAGAVLVVRTLDPNLAPLLPQLGGLVAETGSVLSHLAILARELGVPTVVGVENATTTLLPGTTVVVDGTSGEVTVTDEAPSIDLREPVPANSTQLRARRNGHGNAHGNGHGNGGAS